MTTRPALFAELCAGSAAVTLRLLGGPHAKPPISYMGSKRGYAHAILEVLGLRSGIGADAVLLCDPGPWSRVWSVLTRPEGCQEVARIIRGWADEEPRALWERLRAERPLEGEEGVAQYLVISGSNRLINVDHDGERWANTGEGGTTFGGEAFATDPRKIAAWRVGRYLSFAGEPEKGHKRTAGGAWPDEAPRVASMDLSSLPWPPVLIGRDARGVSPRDVAGWLVQGSWCYKQGAPESGGPVLPGDRRQDTTATATATATARLASAFADVKAAIHNDARTILPDALPAGCYVYIDPPYRGTTPYAHDLPREDVLEMARRWSDAGAVVCISEAEPLPLDGWRHVEITHERKGQKRTFSRQQREWLTLNREPAVAVDAQEMLFGEAA